MAGPRDSVLLQVSFWALFSLLLRSGYIHSKLYLCGAIEQSFIARALPSSLHLMLKVICSALGGDGDVEVHFWLVACVWRLVLLKAKQAHRKWGDEVHLPLVMLCCSQTALGQETTALMTHGCSRLGEAHHEPSMFGLVGFLYPSEVPKVTQTLSFC